MLGQARWDISLISALWRQVDLYEYRPVWSSAWSTQGVLEQLGIHRETLCQKNSMMMMMERKKNVHICM